MKFNVLTLFPEMFSIMNESIIGRAIENNKIEINAVNIRDFADNKHNRVDDYLVGETEAMYEELSPTELKKRMKIVDLIGNKNVFFDEDQ